MTVKAIIFDLGGVYFSNGTQEVMCSLKDDYNIAQNILEEIFYSLESFQLRQGKLSSKEYWGKVYEKYPKLKQNNLSQIWYDAYKINKEVVEVVKELKGKYILGVFSDNIPERISYLDSKYQFGLDFDFQLYSFEHGFNKINKSFYKKLDEKLRIYGALKEETMLVDDHKECLSAGASMGFSTLLYRPDDGFKKSLVEKGVEFLNE